MSRLLILGAGQYGQVVKKLAEAVGWTEIAFLDDKSELAVGKLNDIEKIEYDGAIVAIGDSDVRKDLYKRITKCATIIHPRAVVFGSVGEGSVVEPNAVIYGTVGKGCIVMSNSVVGHDATVGDWCQIKYGAIVSERQNIPAKTKVDYNDSL